MYSIKSFYFVATVIVFLLIVLYFLHPITNLVGDMGYYLKIGEVIVKTKSVPNTNLFSYTNPDFPFINANWLSEVLFYLIHTVIGFNGMLLVSVFLALISFGCIFTTAVKRVGFFTPLILSLISVQILFERTDIKPELFSYLFLSLFLLILYKYRTQFTRWIYALIPIELLWANLHIYFFVGIVVLMCFLIEELFQEKWKLSSQKTRTLIIVAALSILSIYINPFGIRGGMYPLFVLNNYAFPVEENINFFTAVYSYTDTTFLFFEISVVLLWVSLFMSAKKLKVVDWLLAVFFTAMGFFAVRAFPLFVFGTFIPFSVGISHISKLMFKNIKPENTSLFEAGIFFGLLVLLAPTIIFNLQIHGFGFGVVDNAYDSVQFIKTNHVQGPIFNNFDIGNYLDYRLYPQERVFVDNRAEAYPAKFFNTVYLPMEDSKKSFADDSKIYKLNVIIFAHTDGSPDTSQFLYDIVRNPEWRMVYLNNTVVIFLKNNLKNKSVINRYTITEKNVKLSQNDLNDKNKVRQLVNFFRIIDWENEWLAMNEKYLQFEPNNCPALQNIAYILQKNNDPAFPIYMNKYTTVCVK